MDCHTQLSDCLEYELCCDTVIESDLNLDNIELFLSTFDLFDCKFGKILFYMITKGKILFGILSNVAPKTKQCLFESGSCVSESGADLKGDKNVLKMLKENRTFLIISLSCRPYIVVNPEILKDFKGRISQEIQKETLIKRKLDGDILLALFVTQSLNGTNDNGNHDDFVFENTDSKSKNKRKTGKDKRSAVKKRKEQSLISSLSPRKPRSTTSVDIEVVLPNERKEYNQIDFPRNRPFERQHTIPDEHFSIQATETDTGQLSFEPSFSRLTSSSGQRARTSNHEATDVQSAQPSTHDSRNTSERKSESRLLIPSKPPRYPDYVEQQKRLESFNTLNWSIDNNPNPISLAEIGFFYTDKQDLVRCHQCGIGLKDWVADDDVLTEHVKHSPSCDFLVQTYGKSRIDRMKQMVVEDKPNGSNASTNIPQVPYKVRSPRYQTMEARIASFETFPKNVKIPHQQLAVAGLFYTGQGDLCRCFTCDGGLKDWSSGDDPIKEHATYFPKCSYIIKLKGVAYIEEQQKNRQGAAGGGSNDVAQPMQTLPTLQFEQLSIVDTNTEYSSLNVSQIIQQMGYAEMDVITARAELERTGNLKPSAEDLLNTLLDLQERNPQSEAITSTKEANNDLQTIVEENKKLTSLIYCMLCVTGEADILFLPCTHHRVCHECSKDVILCPVCNEFIKEKVKTYRA